MRPLVLNPLFASLISLPGVGPKLERLFARLLDHDPPRVIDLLFHLPSGAIDRRARPKLRDVQPGQVVTVTVKVDQHRPGPSHRSRAPYRIYTSDDTGTLTLTYFNARKDYLEKLLPEGATRYVSGTAEFYDGQLQMVHPDRVVDEQSFAALPLIEPVYSLTECVAAGNLRRAMEGALAKLPDLPEWQDEAWVSRERFPSFALALRQLHRPAEPHYVAPESTAWTRLAYDELLAGQLALALVRAHMRRQAGRGSASEGRMRARILKSLPYALTHSQQKALDDITADLARPQRMLRLLQGDVGSGKTVVALAAAAAVIEAGRQAAFMAPTEILARQHLATIAPLASASPSSPGANVALRGRRFSTASRLATLISWSAPTRCSRRRSLFTTSHSPSSTNSIDSAFTSAWPWRRKAKRSTCWCSPPRQSRARLCSPISVTWTSPNCARSHPAANRSIPAPFRSLASRRSRKRWAVPLLPGNAPIGSVHLLRIPRRSTSPPRRRASTHCANVSARWST